MVSVSFLSKLFGGGAQASSEIQQTSKGRVDRRSSGLKEFTRNIAGQEALSVLDLGATSATNISFLTNHGHALYTEDVLAAAWGPELQITGEDGKPTVDVSRFLSENMKFQGRSFDAVLCWDVADYLPESLVKPVIEKLCSVMKPGGTLLAFFHTRDAGPDAPYYRYHLAGDDMLQLQPTTKGGAPQFRLQRAFNNRHIENLFHEFASLKFFLTRDNVREVIVVR
jgi:SAM-dependent methyltransferase